MLIPRLLEVIAEGHKALVFSQFTSLLALLRPRLDALDTGYEYLDGRTRDRAARVERFQSDPACRLFLISLKAGGLGLNLTAAEYVFLLDPWWNPAVEAQAIDRAHRIGQSRHVFAYRLLAGIRSRKRLRSSSRPSGTWRTPSSRRTQDLSALSRLKTWRCFFREPFCLPGGSSISIL